jgi:hypothetical protein
MLYDLSPVAPESGSLLESLFLVLTKRRQEAEFLRTRVLVEATLAPHLEGKSKISETFSDYFNAMFPWIKNQKSATETLMAQALEQWVGKKVLRVRPLWQSNQKPKKLKSSLERGRSRVEARERLKTEGKTRRI